MIAIKQLEELVADLKTKKAKSKQDALKKHLQLNNFKSAINEGKCIAYNLCIRRIEAIINNNNK